MLVSFYFCFTRTNHLQERVDKFPQIISKFCSEEKPLIYLMDNINLYKGLPVHRSIFNRARTSTVLNYTVKAVMKTKLNGIEWMLEDTNNFLESQGDINKLEATDVSLGK